MDKVRIAYKPRPDATPDSEAAVLAAVYRFILDLHAEKDAAARSTRLHPRKEVPDEPLTR